jgi:hypothetical protein
VLRRFQFRAVREADSRVTTTIRFAKIQRLSSALMLSSFAWSLLLVVYVRFGHFQLGRVKIRHLRFGRAHLRIFVVAAASAAHTIFPLASLSSAAPGPHDF